MPLALFVCDCGNAAPLGYQTIQAAGVKNWATVPIHKGKKHVLSVLSHFPTQFQALAAYQELIQCINTHNTFVVLLGYDDECFYWSNIKSNSHKDTLDAIAIAKRFAE